MWNSGRTSIPPLTAVDLGLDEISSEAVERLVAILDGISDTEASSASAPSLVIRESTAGSEA